MKKILLVNLPFEKIYEKTSMKGVAPSTPPLSLACIGGSLLEKKHKVKIFDFNLYGEEEFIKILNEFNPEFVGISFVTPLIKEADKVAKIVKKVNKKIIVIGGGAHCSSFPESSLKETTIDISIIGEGDFTIQEIVDGKKLKDILGIAYKQKNKIIINERREPIKDLDDLPFSAHHLYEIDKYNVPPAIAKKNPVAWLETCYDDQTELLTENGWKLFKDLKKTDKIATLNPITKILEYHHPTKIIISQYTGEMYRFKSLFLDLLVTPNHKVYVKRKRKSNNFNFEEARNLFGKTQLTFKRDAIWKGINKKFIDINGEIYLMNDWLEFLGYYISEGNVYHNKKTHSWKVKISQNRNSKHYEDIKNCIKRLGFNYYEIKDNKRENVGGFEISKKSLYLYLNQFGYCYQKYIPKEIKQLSSKQLKILLKSLIYGDGHIFNENRFSYISTSKKLIDDVQEIALKIGYSASYSLKTQKKFGQIRGRIIKSVCPCYCTNITNKRNTPTLPNYSKDDGKNGYHQIKKEDYNGKIYCCEVKNHIVYVRRNGKPVWCGNSRGCIFGCTYCNKSCFGRTFRVKSPKRVVKEFIKIKEQGFKEIHLTDDGFTTDIERAKKICDLLIRKKVNINWSTITGIRVDRVDLELLKKMKKAGCYRVYYGIESGNQEIINNIKKGITLEQVEKAVKWAKLAKLEVAGYFMIGLPGETEETMQDTINFAKKLNLDLAKISITIPLPATEMFNELDKRRLIKTRDWEKFKFYSTPSSIYNHENLSWETIESYYKKFYRAIFLNHNFILKRIKNSIRNKTLIDDIKMALTIKWI